jgi:hypothetical protein
MIALPENWPQGHKAIMFIAIKIYFALEVKLTSLRP